MLTVFRRGSDQNLNNAPSAQSVVNHSPTDSDPISGKTSSALSEYRSSESSSPTRSLESPVLAQSRIQVASLPNVFEKNNEIPEDLSLPRRATSSSSSSSASGCYKCPQCMCEFVNENMLQLHMVSRHSSLSSGAVAHEDDQSVRCQYCGVLLLDPNYLQKHMEDAHGHQQSNQSSKVISDSIKCPECNQSFPNEITLRGHLFDNHMSFSGPPTSLSDLEHKPTVLPTATSVNVYCSLCKRSFSSEVELWTHMRFQHLHDTTAVNTLLNLQTPNSNAVAELAAAAAADSLRNISPQKFIENINEQSIVNQQNKIFNVEAYCELCDKEFCNKYFLKTHKANKHGVYCDDLSPASMVLAQKNSAGEFSNNATTPPLTNSSAAATTPIDCTGGLKNNQTSANACISLMNDQQIVSSSPTQASLSFNSHAANFMPSSADSFCPLCRQFFPNQLFLHSHMMTAHNGGVQFGPSLNPAAVYAMMGAAAANPFLQNMKFINQHMAAAMFGMIPPTAGSGSPQLHSTAAAAAAQQMPTSAAMEYHLGIGSSRSNHGKLDFNGEITNGSSSNSSGHKDAFCELCQKEFCNKYFLKTHKINKHGILDDSFNDSPTKKMKTSPDLYQANEALGLEAGEIVKEKSHLQNIFNAESSPSKGSSSLTEVLNKPPINNLKIEAFDGQPPTKVAKTDLNANGRGSSTPENTQQVSCTLCMKSFPSLFALVAHKYRDHGSFDGNINALATAMNVGGQSSPILPQMKMETSPQRPSNGSSATSSAVPSSVDPDAYCEICKKEFCSKYFLRTHKLNIHGIVMECSPTQTTNGHGAGSAMNKDSTPKTPRPLVTGKNFCDICNKELCNKYFLRTHMLKMHGIVIDENKTVIGNINTLDKEMHGQLLFRCDVCNKELGTRQQLKIHKHSVHSITSTSPTNNCATPCSDVSNKLNSNNKDQSVVPPNVTISSLALGSKCESRETANDQTSENRNLIVNQTDSLINNQYHEFSDTICNLCNQRFKNVKWLRAHMITDHSSLQWRDSFEAQLRNDSTNEQNIHLQCEYCNTQFADHVELQMHVIDTHQKEVEGKATYLAEQAALDNIGAFGSESKSPVSDAEPCDLTTGTQGRLYSSSEGTISATIDEVVSGGTPIIQEQDQNFVKQVHSSSSSNDLPMVAKNNNGTKMYKCSYCNYYTRWISNLSTHEKRHNATQQLNGTDRPFVCRVCLRAYRYAHSLQRHMDVHRLSSYGMQMQMNASVFETTSTNNNVSCSNLSTSASTSPSVNSASRNLFPATPCTVSPQKSFTSDDAMLQQQSAQYQCNVCEKQFRNRELYRLHMWTIHKSSPPKDIRQHNGSNSTATASSKAISNVSSPMVNSNVVVSPKKIYRCKICGVGARIYQELCLHLTESHGIIPKQKSTTASSSPQKKVQSLSAYRDQNRVDEQMNGSNSLTETPERENGKGKVPYPISHGTPQRMTSVKTAAQPFMMQPFLMKETVESGIFVPSIVYLPVTKEVDGLLEANFTCYPIRSNECVGSSDGPKNDQSQPFGF